MLHSESVKEIAAALAKFQAEIKDPSRNGKNPHFKSRYVQLDGLLASVRPVLAKHGLSLMQSTGGDGANISVSTLIMHTSGEWIETEPLVLKAQQANPQGAGSACTYGRRFSLSAALGVAWDDDDDGNAACEAPKAPAQKDVRQDAIHAAGTDAKRLGLTSTDMKEILRRHYKKTESSKLTEAEAVDLVGNIEQYAAEIRADDAALLNSISN